jgi:hypothetical protein
MVDVTEVERRVEKTKEMGIAIQHHVGGVVAENLADVIRIAELYARSGVMVPPHCRDKPGTCFALCQQAHEWGMPYLGVINQSYVVVNRGVERIAYQSQIIHAVIERNAPLKGRLRYEIVGADDERRCKVWGTFKGENEPHVYTSETLGKLRDARGRNQDGVLKGSPYWEQQPEVQLFYSASRQWARLFCPDVILGAYTPEDPVYEMRDVTPAEPPLVQRLREAKAHGDRGFDLDHVRREAGRTVIEGDATPGTANEEAKDDRGSKPDRVDDGGPGGDGNPAANDQKQDGGSEAGQGDPAGSGASSGEGAAPAREASAGQGARAKAKPQAKRR